jgi:exonuclease III
MLCIYRPPPNNKNKLKDSTFFEEFSQALDHYNVRASAAVILGDFNIHWDSPSSAITKQAVALLDNYSLD